MTINELGDLFTVDDYMKLTGRCKRLAYQDIKQPGFPVIKLGDKSYRIIKSKFLVWLENKLQESKTA
jgi:hypothetical protein